MLGFCSASRHIWRRSSSVSFLLDIVVLALVGVRSELVPADSGVVTGAAGRIGGWKLPWCPPAAIMLGHRPLCGMINGGGICGTPAAYGGGRAIRYEGSMGIGACAEPEKSNCEYSCMGEIVVDEG